MFHRSFTNCECPISATNCTILVGISVAVATMYHENETLWCFLVSCLIVSTSSIRPTNGLHQSKRYNTDEKNRNIVEISEDKNYLCNF